MESNSPSARHNLGGLAGSCGHGDVDRNGDVETRAQRLRAAVGEWIAADVDADEQVALTLFLLEARGA